MPWIDMHFHPCPACLVKRVLQRYDLCVFVADVRVFKQLCQRDGVINAKTLRRAGAV